jgi:hydroxymethylbilane synthase
LKAIKDANALGIALGEKLLDQGAKAILDEVYAADLHKG